MQLCSFKAAGAVPAATAGSPGSAAAGSSYRSGAGSQRGGWEENGSVPAPQWDQGKVWNAQRQKSDKDHQLSKDPGNDSMQTHTFPRKGTIPL